MNKTIILVDDEELFRERLAKAFSQRGFTVFTAGGFDEALRVIEAKKPNMGVLDRKSVV